MACCSGSTGKRPAARLLGAVAADAGRKGPPGAAGTAEATCGPVRVRPSDLAPPGRLSPIPWIGRRPGREPQTTPRRHTGEVGPPDVASRLLRCLRLQNPLYDAPGWDCVDSLPVLRRKYPHSEPWVLRPCSSPGLLWQSPGPGANRGPRGGSGKKSRGVELVQSGL